MKSAPPLYGPPKVGGDALSFCTKCRMELAHVIVSMVDGKPFKVQCKTCKGVHRYKTSGNAVPVRRTPGTRTAAPKQVIRVAEMWQQKMAAKSKADVADYKTNRRFAVGEVVQHPNFGLGIVEELRAPNKMVVLFRESEKVLIHGNA